MTKISVDDLQKMFGLTIPLEAVQLITTWEGYTGELRLKLEEIAVKHRQGIYSVQIEVGLQIHSNESNVMTIQESIQQTINKAIDQEFRYNAYGKSVKLIGEVQVNMKSIMKVHV